MITTGYKIQGAPLVKNSTGASVDRTVLSQEILDLLPADVDLKTLEMFMKLTSSETFNYENSRARIIGRSADGTRLPS